MQHSSTASRPLDLSPSTESRVYGLFALAMALTVLGIWVGIQFAVQIMTSGMHFLFLILELAILFTSHWWKEKSPLNLLLFAAFPVLSGLTITPYILYVLLQYGNGASILLNAFGATAFMALAAAVFARTTQWNLSLMARGLFFALLGLIAFGLLQLFVPALRGGSMEVLISAAGVIIFALFTAYDVQRVQQMSRMGANPFLLALSLYLDLFNLFLYVLRLMLAMSGERRRSW